MLKIRIQMPLNVSRGFETILLQYFKSKEGISLAPEKIEIINPLSGACSQINGLEQIDIFIGFIPELFKQSKDYFENNFLNLKKYCSIRKELMETGLRDNRGYLQPIAIVPFVYFYNPNYTNASIVPSSWQELLDKRWKGKVLMPDDKHIAPQVIKTILKHENPTLIKSIDENIVCEGMPPNVIDAIEAGEFSIGITNISFGIISKIKNIQVASPNDGYICMPQIIACRNKVDKEIIEDLIKFLLSKEIQDLFSQQSFISVREGGKSLDFIGNITDMLKWPGWQKFCQVFKNR